MEEAKIKEAEAEKALAAAKKKVQLMRLAYTLAISTGEWLEKKNVRDRTMFWYNKLFSSAKQTF